MYRICIYKEKCGQPNYLSYTRRIFDQYSERTRVASSKKIFIHLRDRRHLMNINPLKKNETSEIFYSPFSEKYLLEDESSGACRKTTTTALWTMCSYMAVKPRIIYSTQKISYSNRTSIPSILYTVSLLELEDII